MCGVWTSLSEIKVMYVYVCMYKPPAAAAAALLYWYQVRCKCAILTSYSFGIFKVAWR